MPEPSDPGVAVTASLAIPAGELQWRFSRASGPGGQGVNTTDSRVQLSWSPARSRVLDEAQRDRITAGLGSRLVDGSIVVTAARFREQRRNRADAAERLGALVAAALAPAPRSRRPTRPGRGAQRRRLESKRRRSDLKQLRRNPAD